MNAKESLKRIRQETCPATYMPDFDKEECCKTIEKALAVLDFFEGLDIDVEKHENELGEMVYLLTLTSDLKWYKISFDLKNEETYNLLEEWLDR